MREIPQGFRLNAAGNLVAEANIRPQDMLEDELVTKLAIRAANLSADLFAFRTQALAEITAFRDLVAQQYGATKGGAGGNMTLTSFDGSVQVQVAVAKSITFGPELQAAKELIDDCVTRWSEGANNNLRTLVFDAFQTDRQGKISTDKVLGLRRLEIADETWARAMDAISDAVRVIGSKTYLRVYRRFGGVMQPISLDIANVGGEQS